MSDPGSVQEEVEDFKVGETRIRAGERKTVDLAVSRLYTHTPITLPVQVVRGKQQGPCLFVSAGIHGDEVLGVEIIRRLLSSRSLRRLKGTLLAVPVVNVFGFINLSRYSPDRRDLNRYFPGTECGSLTSRLARLFMQEIVSRASYGIDIHTGSNHRVNLPQIRAYLDDPETRKLAEAFGAPVILDADLLEGSLRQAVKDRGGQILLYEAGECLRFDEVAIRAGLRGILNVMREIGMLSHSRRKRTFSPAVARSSSWIRAPRGGIVRCLVPLGASVREGQLLAQVGDPFGESQQDVTAPQSGLIIGMSRIPLVHQGDALFHLAQVQKSKDVEATLEAFQQEFEPRPDYP